MARIERRRVLLSTIVIGILGCGGSASAPRVATQPQASSTANASVTGPRPVMNAGGTEPQGPDPLGSRAPLRVAVDLAALRATSEGRELGRSLSSFPQAAAFRSIAGVDVFEDGSWLVAYGTNFVEADASALVVRSARSDDQLRPHTDRPANPREAFLRPQAQIAALVPAPKARKLSTELAAPLDPVISNGEIVHLTMRDAAWRFPLLPRELDRVVVVVRVSDGGGFDVAATAECANEKACAKAAEKLRATALRLDALVREELRGLLASLAHDGIRAVGSRLQATVHLSPERLHAVVKSVEEYATPQAE